MLYAEIYATSTENLHIFFIPLVYPQDRCLASRVNFSKECTDEKAFDRCSNLGPGMMGSDGFGRVPMHPYMVDALAEALDLTPEAVQERLGASETPWEIAVSSGLNEEQARKVLSDAHIAALDAAVADGAISQEQADWIRDRMQWRWENDFEFMQGPCHGGWWGNR